MANQIRWLCLMSWHRVYVDIHNETYILWIRFCCFFFRFVALVYFQQSCAFRVRKTSHSDVDNFAWHIHTYKHIHQFHEQHQYLQLLNDKKKLYILCVVIKSNEQKKMYLVENIVKPLTSIWIELLGVMLYALSLSVSSIWYLSSSRREREREKLKNGKRRTIRENSLKSCACRFSNLHSELINIKST